MNIGKHARVVAAALAIGGAVLSLGTGQAEAKPKTTGSNDVHCSRWENGHWEFYVPGDVVTSATGPDKWQCGTDGGWHQVGRTDDSGGRTNNGGGLGTYGAP